MEINQNSKLLTVLDELFKHVPKNQSTSSKIKLQIFWLTKVFSKDKHNFISELRDIISKSEQYEEIIYSWYNRITKEKELDDIFDFVEDDFKEHHINMFKIFMLSVYYLANYGHWTDKESYRYLVDDDIHEKLIPAVEKYTTLNIEPPFGFAFIKGLCHRLGSYETELIDESSSLFPLVNKQRDIYTIGKFVCSKNRRSSETSSQKELYIDPEQAFALFDNNFKGQFTNVAKFFKLPDFQSNNFSLNSDVCIKIQPYGEDKYSRNLNGNSGSGALALSVMSLLKNETLLEDSVYSFSISSAENVVDGNAHQVDFAVDKLKSIKRYGFKNYYLSHEQYSAMQKDAQKIGIDIIGINAVIDAYKRSRSILGNLEAFFNKQINDANTLPRYLKVQGFKSIDNVRVKVRISSKKLEPSDTKNINRENIFIASAEDRSLYRYKWHFNKLEEQNEADAREEKEVIELLDWESEAKNRINKGFILGDPGMGKSWLLKWEEKDTANKNLELLKKGNIDEIVIPIRLRFEQLVNTIEEFEKLLEKNSDNQSIQERYLGKNLKSVILHFLDNQLDSWGLKEEETIEVFKTKIESDQFLLLIDALDELPSEKRNKLKEGNYNLGRWIDEVDCKIYMTSRIMNFDYTIWSPADRESERIMELIPFEYEQRNSFVDKWFDGDAQLSTSLKDLLDESVQLGGMSEVPLLLSLICILYGDRSRKQNENFIPLNKIKKYQLYNEIMIRIVGRDWKDEVLKSDIEISDPKWTDYKFEFLAELSYRLFCKEQEQFSLETLKSEIKSIIETNIKFNVESEFAEYLLELRREDTKNEQYAFGTKLRYINDLINEIGLKNGLLTKIGEDIYMFLHLTFQEYLTSKWIANKINKKDIGWQGNVEYHNKESIVNTTPETILDKKAWDPRWQQVIIFTAGQIQEDYQIELLKIYKDKDKDDLFRHRLALAAFCLPEIVEQ